MKHEIGSMQGRLLKPLDQKIQSFPIGNWEVEFPMLREIGYDSIELTIDFKSWIIHPLNSEDGRSGLQKLAAENNIKLRGICSDIFMEYPLVGNIDEQQKIYASQMLVKLIEGSAEVGLGFIELPLVGANTIRGEDSNIQFRRILDWAIPLAEKNNIDLLLETDLPPTELINFLRLFNSENLGVNYDTGNSTWFGFDPIEEIKTYHSYIKNIHIKDCTIKDYSVPLGTGSTDFAGIFTCLAEYDYAGNFILQAARQEDDVQAAKSYLNFTRDLISKYL